MHETCSTCGEPLEATSAEGLGCMFCLLQAGLTETDQLIDGGLESNDRFGIYQVERDADGKVRELGRGAMGITVAAVDTTLNRTVALKIIHAHAKAGSTGRERFMRGARVAAALRHPNVATIYHFGVREETGEFYYAMELVEGETLEERVLRTGPLDSTSVVAIGEQVAEALAEAEKRGLVHRDLKPANLMLVDAEGEESAPRVKIIDFGLAKALADQTNPMMLTRDGFVGTPAFASPEQFAHVPLDVRSDIYSLGMTLWFALTGKSPFPGRNVEEIREAQASGKLPLGQLEVARVPRRLRALLQRMLALEPAARPSTHELKAELDRCRPHVRYSRKSLIGLTVLILILAVPGFFIFRASKTGTHSTQIAAGKSLAVLPFVNTSRDPDAAFFVEGVRAQIGARLAKVPNLNLVSPSTSHDYDTAPDKIATTAAELGVVNVLEGTAEKSGDNLRVSVRVIDTRAHRDVWTKSYDRAFADIFQIEATVAADVAAALGMRLPGAEKTALAAAATSNPRAYEAYLKGRYVWLQRTSDGYKQAKEYFEQAIALDPKYARAYAGLADTYQFMGAEGIYFRKENYDKAKAACKKALELDPLLPEGHACAGLIAMNYDWEWALAEQELKKAIALDPNNALMHDWFAEYLMAVGRTGESIVQIEKARKLDPFSLVINSDKGKLLLYARFYDEAEAQLKETLRMNPDFFWARIFLVHLHLMQHRYDEALAQLDASGAWQENAWHLGVRGYICGMAGRRAEAEQMLADIQRLGPQLLQSDKTCLVYACLGVGDKDRAFAYLEEDYRNHATSMACLKSNPWFDPLRSDPRFVELVRKVHLAP